MKYIKWLYLIQGIFCFLFYHLSDGLVFHSEEGLKYVSELHSSGSEDDLAILFIGFFSLLSMFALLFIKNNKYIKVVVLVSLILQLFSSTLIQMGSIYLTLFYDLNVYLHVAFLSEVAILFLVVKRSPINS